jgi:hypothetical protein
MTDIPISSTLSSSDCMYHTVQRAFSGSTHQCSTASLLFIEILSFQEYIPSSRGTASFPLSTGERCAQWLAQTSISHLIVFFFTVFFFSSASHHYLTLDKMASTLRKSTCDKTQASTETARRAGFVRKSALPATSSTSTARVFSM